jgi:hypothetical protein
MEARKEAESDLYTLVEIAALVGVSPEVILSWDHYFAAARPLQSDVWLQTYRADDIEFFSEVRRAVTTNGLGLRVAAGVLDRD